MKKLNALALSSLTAALLIGCGGGGGSSSTASNATPTTQTLTFIDDKVSGVKYVNGSVSGFTDANGNFPYTSGIVSFYLGDIKLGEISSIPSDKNVFVQDVVGVSRTDTSNAKVLKIASLLQSLDSDNSTDEIEIKEESFNKFKNQSITSIDDNTDVTTLLSTLNITKVSDINAKRHLDNSLKYYGVVSDTTAPTLLSSSILNGATNVSKDASIILTFNNDVRKNLINKDNITLKDASNNPIDFTISLNFNVVTIKPVALSYATSYTLTLKSNIQDYGKNSLGTTDTTISFTTQSPADTTAPTINSASTFTVNENQTTAFTANATDDRSSVTYSISGTDSSLFSINSSTGIVTFNTAPNYETKNSYSVTLNATDASNNSSSKDVTINISDIDEVAPTITSSTTFTVNENQTSAFTATATDTSGISSYALSGTDVNSFNIDSTTGIVTFKTNTDYETKSSYSIILTATDSQNNSSSQNVTINIVNLDETTPTFTSSSTVSVNENQLSVITATATDDSTITYSLNGTDVSYFDIVSNTGVITFKTTPDYETKSSYSITVKATDTSNNIATQNLTVNLNDVDEVAPIITSPSSSSVSVPENQTTAFTVIATDSSSITYSISGGADASSFSIDSSGTVTFNLAPDYETKTSYSVTVKATDSSNNFSTKDVTVGITDVSEVVYDITFNGVGYNIITSPITNKRWLDRNLGATQACTSSTDTLCYGDYYQWGRLADGHEKATTSAVSGQSNVISNVTPTNFLYGNSDWTTADSDGSLRSALWSKTDGTGVCPVGFRVPTITELKTETLDYAGVDNTTTGAVKVIDSATAFSNFLKFPVAGYRGGFDGSMYGQGSWGDVWTSSVTGSRSRGMYFDSGSADWYGYGRASGFSVRCVEN